MNPTLKARMLTKRADFLRIKAQGQRVATSGFSLQILPMPEEEAVALGITCAKRSFGNAIKMNRGRRRLREAWRQVAHAAPQGVGLVLVGRTTILEMPWAQIIADMQTALEKAVLLTQKPKTGTNQPE